MRHVAISDLQPGDLVFYYSPISHVGIYIGGGRIIDAPYPGLNVHITGLHSMPLVGPAGRRPHIDGCAVRVTAGRPSGAAAHLA